MFDLDGTVIDSTAAIVWCVNETGKRHGYAPIPASLIEPLIGVGLLPLLARFFDEAESMAPEYRLIYRDGFAERTHIYPDAIEALEALRERGFKTAVLTNRNENLARIILDKLSLNRYFNDMLGEGSGFPLKPDPAGALALIERLGVSPENTWMIGDTDIDVATGRNAGCQTVYVRRPRLSDVDDGACADILTDSLGILATDAIWKESNR